MCYQEYRNLRKISPQIGITGRIATHFLCNNNICVYSLWDLLLVNKRCGKTAEKFPSAPMTDGLVVIVMERL